MELGFTRAEADQLRRISMTLHRWHEGECGSDRACLVRGRWDREAGEFTYDEDGDPYWEFSGASGRARHQRTPDRERGARKRLTAILEARNTRALAAIPLADLRTAQKNGGTGFQPITYYVQGDPRGAALYIIRPGDVPAGATVDSYYTRGICVY